MTDPRLPATADVVVVGAGPAGAAAAIVLAEGGRDVVVLDKAVFPRDKFCGDGLTIGALRRLDELGLDRSRVPSWHDVRDIVLRTPSGREIHYELPAGPGTYAAVARRVELDAALVERARQAGATVLDGNACVGAETHADRIRIDVEGARRIDARYVVAADGMWSPVRRFLGAQEVGYRGEWHAFRQYVRDVSPRASRELFVSFEPDFLPGYAWSFPVGEHGANIGFGIRRGGQFPVGAMGQLWRELWERPHLRAFLGPDATPEGPHRAWPIPAGIDHVQLSAGRALFVGDAAAATDALTGEGIGQALATGTWAAEAMLGAGALDAAEARRRYEETVRHELIPDHRMSSWLSSALSHRKGVRIATWLTALNPWTRRNFARWLFEDYPRAVALTPQRWHRGMFSGPGAFPESGR